MTALVKTITTRLNVLGGSALPRFNSVLWNGFIWGQGNAVLKAVVKFSVDSLTPTEAIAQKGIFKSFLDSIVPTTDSNIENLGDGSGYDYLFPSDTTNAINRYAASYTSGSLVGSSYTSLPVGNGTIWS